MAFWLPFVNLLTVALPRPALRLLLWLLLNFVWFEIKGCSNDISIIAKDILVTISKNNSFKHTFTFFFFDDDMLDNIVLFQECKDLVFICFLDYKIVLVAKEDVAFEITDVFKHLSIWYHTSGQPSLILFFGQLVQDVRDLLAGRLAIQPLLIVNPLARQPFPYVAMIPKINIHDFLKFKFSLGPFLIDQDLP